MARMIPPLYTDNKSHAEYKVFNMFKNATNDGADKWIVFHSKKINHHIRQMNGEIDFLVLVPGLGVAALEVKGGKIFVKDDIWYTNQIKLDDPFRQVEGNIHSLAGEYEKTRKEFPFFAFGVMFPECEFRFSREISYPNWRIFDKSNSGNIIGYVINLLQKTHALYKLKYHNQGRIPSKEDINNLVKFLTLDQEITPYSTWVQEIEESQEKFSNEQKERLYNSTVGHSRCLIEGYTGTGKTIIAVETAKAAFNDGLTVGFFCYNSILSKYLNNELKDYINDNSFVGHLHKFLLQRIEKANLKLPMPKSGKDYFEECKKIDPNAKIKFPEEVVNNDDFWEKTVPQIALEALTLSPVEYDKLIIDEAQDIFIYDYYLDIIGKILVDGTQKGKWSFFADPQQDISKSTNKMSYDEALNYLGIPKEDYMRPPPLTESWRNSKKISEEISKFIKEVSSPKIIEEGVGPEYIQWSSIDNQQQLIEEHLDYLLKEGKILKKQITILTVHDPHQDLSWYENSVISRISDKYNLVEYKYGVENAKGQITYSSINIFKGMENSVIFVVDVESYANEKLLYVGMSRARSILKVFETEQAEKERKKLWSR